MTRTSKQAFDEFDRTNPQVYEMLRHYALEAFNAGITRLGIGMLFERARWEARLATRGDTFQLNNNYRAFYARKLMQDVPQLTGFFSKRRSVADESRTNL